MVTTLASVTTYASDSDFQCRSMRNEDPSSRSPNNQAVKLRSRQFISAWLSTDFCCLCCLYTALIVAAWILLSSSDALPWLRISHRHVSCCEWHLDTNPIWAPGLRHKSELTLVSSHLSNLDCRSPISCDFFSFFFFLVFLMCGKTDFCFSRSTNHKGLKKLAWA